jgi:hypothetical protein
MRKNRAIFIAIVLEPIRKTFVLRHSEAKPKNLANEENILHFAMLRSEMIMTIRLGRAALSHELGPNGGEQW